MDIKITEKTATFIRELAHRMETQHSRSTRSPYYYTVELVEDRIAPEWSGTDVVYHYCDRSFTEKELEEHCKENEIDLDEAKGMSLSGCREEVHTFENVFLTEEGYNKHMELNGHNYRRYKCVGSYVHYAERNPEIASLLDSIREIATAINLAEAGKE